MASDEKNPEGALFRRVHGELADDFDEELELEIDDDRIERMMGDLADHPQAETVERRFYFKELLRLPAILKVPSTSVFIRFWALRGGGAGW